MKRKELHLENRLLSVLAVLLAAAVALLASSCVRSGSREERGIKIPKARVRDMKWTTNPLMQRVSVSFNDKSLGAVLRSITVLTGLDIAVHPKFMSVRKVEKKRVTLTVANLPLRDVLDWLVRQIGGDYQVGDNGSVLITRGYTPIGKTVTGSVFVPGLYLEKDAADLTAILKAAIVPVTMKGGKVIIVPRMSRNLLVIQTSRPVIERIKEIVNALGDTKSLSPMPPPSNHLEKILYEKILFNYRRVDVWEIMERIRGETGLNVGCRTDLMWRHGIRREINMSLGHVSVRNALDKLVSRVGLERWDLEPSRGVWLYGKNEKTHRASGEMPWHGTIVRAYPAGDLVRKREPAELEGSVRAVCSAASPAVLVRYSKATSKLLVIEEPAVMKHVEEYLKLAHMVAK